MRILTSIMLTLIGLAAYAQTGVVKRLGGAVSVTTMASTSTITIGTAPNVVTIDGVNGLKLNGTATVWDDLRVDGQNFGSGPSAPALTDNFLGVSGLQQRMFQGSSQDDEAFFNIQLPHQWKQGGGLEIHIHMTPWTTPEAADSAVFQFSYSWANIGSAFPTSLTTDTTCIHLNGTAQWEHKLAELTNLATPANGKTLSSMLVCSLKRLAHTNDNDTYTGGISVLYVDLHYEIDSMGSKEEVIK